MVRKQILNKAYPSKYSRKITKAETTIWREQQNTLKPNLPENNFYTHLVKARTGLDTKSKTKANARTIKAEAKDMISLFRLRTKSWTINIINKIYLFFSMNPNSKTRYQYKKSKIQFKFNMSATAILENP